VFVSEWQPVIGMEIHVQLKLNSKLFSAAPVGFGAAANAWIEAVDVGLPGSLPVVQRAAVEAAIRLGLALDAQVSAISRFSRKHYAYADLPKGYQITQGEPAIVMGGQLPIIDGDEIRWVPIQRAHLEEDAGKSSHAGVLTQLDYNRSGTPLIEVVTAPVLTTPQQAMMTFRSLRQLVMALGICDGNLQEGSMRADANVSVHRAGEPLGTRVELKNINSPRFLHDAVAFEINRQTAMRTRGEEVLRETRLWDVAAQQSRAMRQKEDAFDYRLMPDPDLPPMMVDDAWLQRLASSQPTRPHDHRIRLRGAGVAHAAVEVLLEDAPLLHTFEKVAAVGVSMPLVARFLVNELMGMGSDAHLRVGVGPLAAVLRCHEARP
jgi:aspartyl-tRNA(Asn)/glutamyl-tRNA(Gln) amidotransferase subunit B